MQLTVQVSQDRYFWQCVKSETVRVGRLEVPDRVNFAVCN